ncbi:proton-activated chloride channel [Petromyzon marinus]|uniref:proton-activated chloride channel n=1 Tax=Petromyzon marinus TaxID=7757 RepID=UPI003F705D4D
MMRAEFRANSYSELDEDEEKANVVKERRGEEAVTSSPNGSVGDDEEEDPPGDEVVDVGGEGDATAEEVLGGMRRFRMRVSKLCLKNLVSVLLVVFYLVLSAVASFVAYQSISDFQHQAQHPAMSVSYKAVERYDAPGIALYLGSAELLSCRHYFHSGVSVMERPGQPGDVRCNIFTVAYPDPYHNTSQKSALVVRGPERVQEKEQIFLHFRLNGSTQQFSAIDYLLFSSYVSLERSTNRPSFMMQMERTQSMWTFSGGFRTWVKMSLVRTKTDRPSEEFTLESSVVKYNDERPESERSDELFFIVFEWKDALIQEVQGIVTANPWSVAAVLCGVLLLIFKVADFATSSVRWMIRVRKRNRRHRVQKMNNMAA